MVKVNDDYIIEIDSLNYTVKRDEHRIKVEADKDGNEVKRVPVFTTVGYYGDLAPAILGVIKDMNRRELGDGTHELHEAINIVMNNNRHFEALLEKALKGELPC